MVKPIVCDSNPIVNLLLHVICCFDDSFPRKTVYSEKAKDWLLPEEKNFFEENFRLDQTGKVSSTSEFALLFQLPGYFADKTIESLTTILELMKQGEMGLIREILPQKAQLLNAYAPRSFQIMLSEKNLKFRKQREMILDQYLNILVTIFNRYYAAEWETSICPEISLTRKILEKEYFQELDLIHIWEKKLRISFPSPNFIVELIDPIASLGTNLIAERDAFSSWINAQLLSSFISHEIGTHTLFQTKTLLDSSFAKAFKTNRERTHRLIEAVCYLSNLEIGLDNEKPVEYPPKFCDYFEKEIKALKKFWNEWKAENISILELITESLESP